MPGFIPSPPPPSPPGKLGWLGQTPQTVTPSGLSIVPGAGIYARTQAGQMLLDIARSDPPEEFSLFVPGVIAAGPIGVWKNTRATQKAVSLALEANFLTAQTTADPANYYALKAADVAGTTQVLPFTTAGQSHFSLNTGAGQVIAQPYNNPDTGVSQSGGTCGMLSNFTPTQNLTVTGFRKNLGVAKVGISNTTPQPVQMRGQLLDANLAVLAEVTQTVVQTMGNIYFTFPMSVVLTAGATYHLAVDAFLSADSLVHDDYPAFMWPSSTTSGSNASPISNLNTSAGGRAGVVNAFPGWNPTPIPRDATWADVALPAGKYRAAYFTPDSYGLWITPGPANGASVQLLGAGGAAAFTGDITLSIATVGAPIGTAAGSNLNARVLLST